jgi:hypothetical protein
MCIGCPAERLGKAMKEIHTWRLDREPSDGAVVLRNFYTGYHFSRRMKTLYPVCLFLVAAAPFCCCESPPPTGGMNSGMRNTLEKRVLLSEGLSGDVREGVERAASYLKKAGTSVNVFNLGRMEYTIPACYVIAPSEASSSRARFDGVKCGLLLPPTDKKQRTHTVSQKPIDFMNLIRYINNSSGRSAKNGAGLTDSEGKKERHDNGCCGRNGRRPCA